MTVTSLSLNNRIWVSTRHSLVNIKRNRAVLIIPKFGTTMNLRMKVWDPGIATVALFDDCIFNSHSLTFLNEETRTVYNLVSLSLNEETSSLKVSQQDNFYKGPNAKIAHL